MEQGTQTGRQIVMAVDDSPHSHAAWLFAVHNILRDDDKVVLLHGVTTNVQVPPLSRLPLVVHWRVFGGGMSGETSTLRAGWGMAQPPSPSIEW